MKRSAFNIYIFLIYKLIFVQIENESEPEDVQPTTFVDVPADADQPGPSGVGKTETP